MQGKESKKKVCLKDNVKDNENQKYTYFFFLLLIIFDILDNYFYSSNISICLAFAWLVASSHGCKFEVIFYTLCVLSPMIQVIFPIVADCLICLFLFFFSFFLGFGRGKDGPGLIVTPKSPVNNQMLCRRNSASSIFYLGLKPCTALVGRIEIITFITAFED